MLAKGQWFRTMFGFNDAINAATSGETACDYPRDIMKYVLVSYDPYKKLEPDEDINRNNVAQLLSAAHYCGCSDLLALCIDYMSCNPDPQYLALDALYDLGLRDDLWRHCMQRNVAIEEYLPSITSDVIANAIKKFDGIEATLYAARIMRRTGIDLTAEIARELKSPDQIIHTLRILGSRYDITKQLIYNIINWYSHITFDLDAAFRSKDAQKHSECILRMEPAAEHIDTYNTEDVFEYPESRSSLSDRDADDESVPDHIDQQDD